jgi:hypothetical protein
MHASQEADLVQQTKACSVEKSKPMFESASLWLLQ